MTLTEAMRTIADVPEATLKKRHKVTKEQQAAINTILGAYKKIHGVHSYSIASAYYAIRTYLREGRNYILFQDGRRKYKR